MTMNIHQKLKQARKNKNLSQQDVANMLGYKSFTTIQKWEDGTSLPPLKIYQQLMALYEFNLHDEINTLGDVRAGAPLLAVQEAVMDHHMRYYYLRVVGDSMKDARILEGDEVLVRAQDMVDNGKIGVILVGEEATIKRVYIKENGILLKAENADYKDLFYTFDDEIKILGEVIEVKIKL